MTSTLHDLEDSYYLAVHLRDALDNGHTDYYDDDPAFEALVHERAHTARDCAFAAARAEVRAVASALPLGEFARLAELLGHLAAIEGHSISSILEDHVAAA
jgi:hypothetical protein